MIRIKNRYPLVGSAEIEPATVRMHAATPQGNEKNQKTRLNETLAGVHKHAERQAVPFA